MRLANVSKEHNNEVFIKLAFLNRTGKTLTLFFSSKFTAENYINMVPIRTRLAIMFLSVYGIWDCTKLVFKTSLASRCPSYDTCWLRGRQS